MKNKTDKPAKVGIWKDLNLLWKSITLKQKLSETRKAIVINEMAETSTPGSALR